MKEVICIKTHSQGKVKEGNIYPLLETKSLKCNCGPKILYNVGIPTSKTASFNYVRCPTCNYRAPNYTNYIWFSSELFANLADITELTEILSKEVAI